MESPHGLLKTSLESANVIVYIDTTREISTVCQLDFRGMAMLEQPNSRPCIAMHVESIVVIWILEILYTNPYNIFCAFGNKEDRQCVSQL